MCVVAERMCMFPGQQVGVPHTGQDVVSVVLCVVNGLFNWTCRMYNWGYFAYINTATSGQYKHHTLPFELPLTWYVLNYLWHTWACAWRNWTNVCDGNLSTEPSWGPVTMILRWFIGDFTLTSQFCTSNLSVNCHDGRLHRLPTISWTDGRFTNKLDANIWSVDGETDRRDSLLTNSMQNIGK